MLFDNSSFHCIKKKKFLNRVYINRNVKVNCSNLTFFFAAFSIFRNVSYKLSTKIYLRKLNYFLFFVKEISIATRMKFGQYILTTYKNLIPYNLLISRIYNFVIDLFLFVLNYILIKFFFNRID